MCYSSPVTWGELLTGCMAAMWMTPPPWRFRLAALFIVAIVGVGG
jgi:hypothetical protein